MWELELSLIVVPALWNMLPITVRSIVLLLLLSITAHWCLERSVETGILLKDLDIGQYCCLDANLSAVSKDVGKIDVIVLLSALVRVN